MSLFFPFIHILRLEGNLKREFWNQILAKESNVVICLTGIYRELCLESVKNKYECEIQASRQHCEVVLAILYWSFSFTVCHAFQIQCIFLCSNFFMF